MSETGRGSISTTRNIGVGATATTLEAVPTSELVRILRDREGVTEMIATEPASKYEVETINPTSNGSGKMREELKDSGAAVILVIID